jgi:hypothetical protein
VGTAVPDRRNRMSVKTPPEQIDDIIAMHPDWRGQRLAQLRHVILDAAPGIGEDVKWKKPSRPEGVAVWTHGGNLCIAEVLKRAVRLTFPKGASLDDPAGLFNTRLDSKTVRAVDLAEGDVVHEAALQALIVEAIRS